MPSSYRSQLVVIENAIFIQVTLVVVIENALFIQVTLVVVIENAIFIKVASGGNRECHLHTGH